MDAIRTVRESYDRCCATGDFAAAFYELFFTNSSEILVLFKEADFTQQKRHFRAALLLLIKYQPDDVPTRNALQKVGHSRGEYDIRPDLYPFFIESVCETVKKHDPQWNPELGDQWTERIRDGVELIRSMY
jgi:hemoglobin-like flavoprotein